MYKTKLFMFGYFLPSWVSALLMWGDDRTSALFAPAPAWFNYFKFPVQIVSIMVLFVPFKQRARPLSSGVLLAVALLVSIVFARPTLEAEFILISSSAQIAILAIFLCFAQPTATLEDSDLKFLFNLFLFGFLLQFALYFGFHRLPSHSIEDVFLRFNGITNDSLSVGLLIPVLIPWAIRGKMGELKLMVLLTEAVASGSLFAIIFTALASFGYLLYLKMYRFVVLILLAVTAVGIYYYNLVAILLGIKLLSILTHLRFFLDLGGVQLDQPTASCSEEFCESFIEAGGQLNPLYLVLFLGLLFYFIMQLFGSKRRTLEPSIVLDSLRIFGVTLSVASFVHPIPLIPFAVPMFLIFTSLYTGKRRSLRPAARVAAKAPAALRPQTP
jgi:hypothetical protein